MTSKESSEKFQPKMVASFDRSQLINFFEWGRRNKVTGKPALDRVLQTVGIDEDGNIMDETDRKRLRYGIAAVSGLIIRKQNVNEVLQVQMWQETPDEDKLTMRVTIGPRGVQN